MNDWTGTDLWSAAMRENWARNQVARAGHSWATHTVKFDGTVLPRVDWSEYRKCSAVCRAKIGEPCFSQSGRVVNGQPDGIRTYLIEPHAARVRRKPHSQL
jgi:hypothetical protein